MPRVSNAKETILQTAFELMSRNGYTNTSMDEVVNQSGVKKGTIYYFFASKQQLATEVLEFYWTQTAPKFRVEFAALADSPTERVLMLCKGAMLPTQGDFCGCFLGNMIAEMAIVDCEVGDKAYEILQRVEDLLVEQFEEAVSAGELPVQADRRLLARQMLAYFEGSILMAKGCRDAGKIGELAGGLHAILQAHKETN